MIWERLYLKAWGFWFAIVVTSIALLYFDKPFWAIIVWLAQISHQLTVIMMTVALKRSDY